MVSPYDPVPDCSCQICGRLEENLETCPQCDQDCYCPGCNVCCYCKTDTMGKTGEKYIDNKDDFCEHCLGIDVRGKTFLDSEMEANRRIYKDTECGAWIELKSVGIKIGSIVEGSDAECRTHSLTFPFLLSEYNAAIAELEGEADRLWHEAND